MESVEIKGDRPWIEGVLGPLSQAEESEARKALLNGGAVLVQLAASLSGSDPGKHSGVQLNWLPSGQLSIDGSATSGDDEGNAVCFTVELRPGWFYGDRRDRPRWVIERTVEVDCLHEPDHGGMHVVDSAEVEASSGPAAAVAFACAADETSELARSRSVREWALLGGS